MPLFLGSQATVLNMPRVPLFAGWLFLELLSRLASEYAESASVCWVSLLLNMPKCLCLLGLIASEHAEQCLCLLGLIASEHAESASVPWVSMLLNMPMCLCVFGSQATVSASRW